MCVLRRKEAGFTLLEALIAFLIITIGMAGAALFQSELIAESGASKARSVAVKLAEKELEEQRALLVESDYSALDAIVLSAIAVSNAVSVGNTTYDVSFIASESTGASALAENFYILTANVSWVDAKNNFDSVTINSFLSKNFADQSLDESSQAGNGNGDAGSIEKPGGAAEAIPISHETVRFGTDGTTTVIDKDDNAIVAEAGTYENLDDVAVGGIVNNQDGTYGIKTSECEDVYTNDGTATGYVVSQAVGTLAYAECGIASVIKLKNGSSDITQVFSISGNIYLDEDHGTLESESSISNVTATSDVLTSEGGGCAVYYTDSSQDQLAYTCLFGGGWYGSISINVPLQGPGKPYDTVCLSPRSYKYYILNPAVSAADSVVGQSGLVRFVSAGEGTYLSESAVNPGYGYYYTSDQLVSGATDISGNVIDQHFVIIGTILTAFDNVDANCIDSGPLNVEGITYPLFTNENYNYTTATSVAVVIPDNEIVLGYVNKAFELNGTLIVSMADPTVAFAAASTAQDLINEFAVVARDTDAGDYSCGLSTTSAAGNTVDYSCTIEYEWLGDLWFGYKDEATTVLDKTKILFDGSLNEYIHTYVSGASPVLSGATQTYQGVNITISETP